MNPGLYTAFLGMRARQRTLEVQANNIANASTDGFKAERLAYSTVEADHKSKSESQKMVAGVLSTSETDFRSGTLRETGGALDVSIRGDAFFQIQTPRGVRYTRAGSFTQDAAGQLITKNGDLVVGEKGAITLPKNSQVVIGSDGVLSSDGQRIDKLKISRFENPVQALKKDGDSLFAATGIEEPTDAPESSVLQGTLESSNVSAVTEMVSMINNTREFESLQRSISLMMNDVGRKISTEIGRT
ncbi:MAG: flagellar basal-body rod protein FlgF [Pyrinomonadaceae bacterium]|nr:flagellar basal-body rod protein FlgF [Pyrinomonadaceae bacterium]